MDESKDQFSTFLDGILRSAEGLEQGRKNDSFSLIELDQISNFFSRISSKYEKSDDGCILLAQQGIDTEDTDRLLKSIGKQNEKKETEKNENAKNSNHDENVCSTYRLTNAIELCELKFLTEIDHNWNLIKSTIKFERWSNSIFSKDPSIRIWQARDAESFANAMWQAMYQNSEIFIPTLAIMVAWKDYYFKYDYKFNAKNKIVDYITALDYITKSAKIGNEEFNFQDPNVNSNLQKPSLNILEWLNVNAKLYLEHQYRFNTFVLSNYCDPKSIEQNKFIMEFQNDESFLSNIDEKKIKELRDKYHLISDPSNIWQSIWDLIQSGLSNLITKDLIKKNNNVLNALISMLKYQKGDKSHQVEPIINKSHQEDPLINKCITYASSREDVIFNMKELYKTEDLYSILFYQIINNLKAIENRQDTEANILKDLANNDELLNSIIIDFPDPLEFPIVDIILLKFERFISDIIDLCLSQQSKSDDNKEFFARLPVIAAHFALMFYNVGYFDNPYLKVIIDDLISILPLPKYAPVALGYIVLSRGKGNEQDVIDFLLSLDANEITLKEEMYEFAKENESRFINIQNLLKKLKNDEQYKYEASTIKILTLFEDYENSINFFINCINDGAVDDNFKIQVINDNLNSYDLKDISIFLEISPILIQKSIIQRDDMEIDEYDDTLIDTSIRCVLHALSSSDAFNVTDRIMMLKNAKMLVEYINQVQSKKNAHFTYDFFDSVEPMIKIAEVITAFETGRSDKAMDIAFQTEVLPFNSHDLEKALRLLRGPGLNQSSAIGTAVENIVIYLSKTIFQYGNNTSSLKSIIEFCKYLSLRESVLENIIQIRIRLSLL